MLKQLHRKLAIQLTLFVISFLFFASGCSNTSEQPQSKTIKLAALMAMSGELGSKGEVRKTALEKGVENANLKWQSDGVNWQFELKVADSESDPEITLEKAQELLAEGFEIFITGSSAEVEKLQPWAAEHGVIVISYSSTSPALAIEGDGIFRMVPNDIQQAEALASLLEYEGIYGVVPVYRDDIYGREITELFSEKFKSLQGIVSEPVTYETQETNWRDLMTDISTAVENLNIEQERIAIVLVAFDEAAEMLKQLDEIDGLNDVRWFGTDSVTLSPAILQDEHIGKNAAQVHLTGVTFGIPESDLFASIQSELEPISEGVFLPDALFAYDIAGMLATVINQLDKPFGTEEIMANMIEGSAIYAGVTGWTLLDETGDRKYYHYDVWEVQENNGDSFHWLHTAKFVKNPGVPSYISPISADVASASSQSESFLFGYEGEAFIPDREVSRAEFIYMLMHATNRIERDDTEIDSSFNDANAIDPRAKNAVAIAQQAGIIHPNKDNKFRPNEEITWLEAIVMTIQALEWIVDESTENERLDLTDVTAIQPYIQTAVDQHLFSGTKEEFNHVKNDPISLQDAIFLMIEIMKGEK